MFPEDFPKSFSSAASRESTRPELFCKNSQTSQENNCAGVLFFNKVPETLFLQNTFGQLILKISEIIPFLQISLTRKFEQISLPGYTGKLHVLILSIIRLLYVQGHFKTQNLCRWKMFPKIKKRGQKTKQEL